MLSFAYTKDLQLHEMLRDIDRLRSQILTLAIPVKTEYKLQWEAQAIRIWATMVLSEYEVPKQYVTAILAHPTRPTRSVAMIQAQRAVYDYIHTSWRANPKPVNLTAFETIYSLLYPLQHNFSSHEPAMKELLEYLDAANEHPVIQAAIAHLRLLNLPDLTDPGLLARSIHYLFLAKYGYDLRGYATPERVWHDDPAYRHIWETYAKASSITKWLEYIADGMRTNLETILKDIQESRFHVEFPPSFWELSDRQKNLLKLLENPEEKITNRQVQKRYHVSQITASRDLTHLTSLGLLYPHGKGRSVYYTKI